MRAGGVAEDGGLGLRVLVVPVHQMSCDPTHGDSAHHDEGSQQPDHGFIIGRKLPESRLLTH